MMLLTFADPHNLNQLEPGSVDLCPNSMLNSPLLQPLHEYACTLGLKPSHFCCLGRHCFGKDPQRSPYLLQVINPSFCSLAWLCLFAQHPPRGEASFWVTVTGYFWNCQCLCICYFKAPSKMYIRTSNLNLILNTTVTSFPHRLFQRLARFVALIWFHNLYTDNFKEKHIYVLLANEWGLLLMFM